MIKIQVVHLLYSGLVSDRLQALISEPASAGAFHVITMAPAAARNKSPQSFNTKYTTAGFPRSRV